MNIFEDLLSSPWTQALGWTLLHSVWQSTLVAMFVLLVLRFIPSRYSTLRYLSATAGLASILLLSIGTFFYINSGITPVLKEKIVAFYQKTADDVKSVDHLSFSALAGEVNHFVESNLGAIVLCWSIGAALSSLRLFSGWWYIKRLRREAVLLEGKWNCQVQLLAASLRIHKFIPLAESSFIHTPIVIGHLRPMILFPLGMCSGLTVEQIESIILHELVHIKRNDYLVNITQSFMEAIYFFNPFVWMISSIIRQEREHCCDDAVVKSYGNPLEYVRALATLEETRFSKSGLALSFAQDKNQLLNRIKRIMEKSVKSYSGRERVIPIALLIIGLICASWLTIQTRDVDGNASVHSIQPVILSDTTGKGKSSRRQIQKVVDVNAVVEVEEVVEAKNDVLVDLNLTIPPVPPIPDMDMVVPVDIRTVLDFNTDFAFPKEIGFPGMIFSIPAHFDLDTIPADWRGRDWEEFSKEFEKKFMEKFGCTDYYKDHEKAIEDQVKELEHQFDHRFDEEFAAKMEDLARKQEKIAMYQMDQSRDVWENHEEAMKKFERDMKRWEAENKKQIEMLEENAKIIEQKFDSFEKELRDELIKDGYLKPDEKVNRIEIQDERIIVNKKEIKSSDQKKYKKLFGKFSQGPSEPHRKHFAPIPGRME